MSLIASQYFFCTGFSDDMDIDVNRCNFKMLHIEPHQHLEAKHCLVNLYFPNHQCMLENNAWVKHLFKGKDRLKSIGPLNVDLRACGRRMS